MSKQTAVDWLIKKLYSHSPHIDILDVASLNGYWEQAKEIEKEQIKEAHLNGQSEWDFNALGEMQKKLAEQYYKETYE